MKGKKFILLSLIVFCVLIKQSSGVCYLKKTKLKCTGNMQEIPKFEEKFLNATALSMSYNSITLVQSDAFADLNKVDFINLTRNAIERVEREAFQHKRYLWIDLSYNKLKILGREVFPDDKRLKHQSPTLKVYLHHNPWDCTCALKWMIDLINATLIRPYRIQPTCSTPHQVKGVKLVELKDEDYCVIQECLECDDAAECRMVGNNYACVCKSSYHGNGMFCADVDECAKSSTNNCKPTELCENFAGGYQCICSGGFQRQNDKCVDVNECEPPPVGCGPAQGVCKNTPGSYKCICHAGLKYTADRGCIDFDECKSGEDPCKDVSHSTCVNKAIIDIGDEGYTCRCDEGYIMSGEACVSQGGSSRLYVILGAGSGLFVLVLVVMIVIAVLCKKWRNRKQEKQKDFMMAPVAMTTPIDFAFMDIPQEHAEDAENEEWNEMDSDDIDD